MSDPDGHEHEAGHDHEHRGAHGHDHAHGHGGHSADNPAHPHNAPLSDVQLRVKALESLLTEKGLVDPAALDELIDTYESKVGPRNGARVVAKAWLDPDWRVWQTLTGASSKEEAMVRFLRDPPKYRTWTRAMPDLGITEEEARATVAYLKWMAAIDTNGFPANFGHIRTNP